MERGNLGNTEQKDDEYVQKITHNSAIKRLFICSRGHIDREYGLEASKAF